MVGRKEEQSGRQERFSTPIELIPHAAGLGVGALSKNRHTKHKHDSVDPVIDSDGRVKLHKGLDDKVGLSANACLKAGSYVRIDEEAYEDLLVKYGVGFWGETRNCDSIYHWETAVCIYLSVT